jgi:glycosidase
MEDPESYLELYTVLLHLRRIDPVLISGDFDIVDIVDNMLVYRRSGNNISYFIVMNFSDESRSVKIPHGDVLFLTNSGDIERYSDDGELVLKGLSAVLVKMFA